MIRRLQVLWPDPVAFDDRDGRPLRLLAVSDEREASLDGAANRLALGPLDAILGCGDVEPDWLAFLGDAFGVPVVYVRGNHDRGGQWEDSTLMVPSPLRPGELVDGIGVVVGGLEWPGVDDRGNARRDGLAWRHALTLAWHVLLARARGRRGPVLVISHAPPVGIGDTPTDRFHVGFRAYRWLLRRLRPPLWLHGHTNLAAATGWRHEVDDSVVANVTGAVLVELVATPGSA
jgi:uncharacterized protein